MILITGGTGFIGSRVILRLVQSNIPFKVLLRPKKEMAKLPYDLPVDVVVSSLKDRRSLRAVLSGVTTILHFASAENELPVPDYESVEVEGTEVLLLAAKDAGVKNILFLSRIGADISSTYPLLRAKALAEKAIRNSGLKFTILRLTDVFGSGDHFIREITRYISSAPLIVPVPENGKMVQQPIWVEDVISAIFIILDQDVFQNKIIPIGGGEYLELKKIFEILLNAINKKKIQIPIAPAYLRLYNLWFGQNKRGFPISNKWINLFAVNRTCPLDSLPRSFDILPGRFSHHVDHAAVIK